MAGLLLCFDMSLWAILREPTFRRLNLLSPFSHSLYECARARVCVCVCVLFLGIFSFNVMSEKSSPVFVSLYTLPRFYFFNCNF